MSLLIGALVSGLIQLIKKYFGTATWVTYFLLAIFSLLAGACYYFITLAGYWDAVYQIIISAGAVYTFIIRPLASSNN